MRVHFIAIGGAIMHNLALALHNSGHIVTGSDDEIFEPARSRLEKKGLLPELTGWNASVITPDIDIVILGMHAREDNPELQRAGELGLKVMSFPEFMYEQTKNKKRIVVGGSHGKTTITSMIMHVLRGLGIEFDYLVGSIVEGFETMVNLSDNSNLAVFEGDEYLSSAIDRRPKFHLYNPDIAIISGIAWDHINVFPTFENYVDQFRIFTHKISENGTLIYNNDDKEVTSLAEGVRDDIKRVPYSLHPWFSNSKGVFAVTVNRTVELSVFGDHNLNNLNAAKEACLAAGVSEDEFYSQIGSFKGAGKRLQLIKESESSAFYLDFAHSPSKVKATVGAVADRYHGRRIIACLELHTFSSLNPEFLPQYSGTMEEAQVSIVYFNPHALSMKKMNPLKPEEIAGYFGAGTIVIDDPEMLATRLKEESGQGTVFLMMSSGDFGGIDITELADRLTV